MSTQEIHSDRYRRVLALLPRAYREQRGEEMLAVMLDAAASEGRDGPSFREGLSVLGLSLRLRVGAPGGSPRARSVGDTLRLITLIGLVLQAAAFSYAPGELLGLLLRPTPGLGLGTSVDRLATWPFAGELVGFVCPFLALAALAAGKRTLGLLLTTNVLVLPAAFQVTIAYGFRDAGISTEAKYTLALCAVPTVAGLLGFHRDAPRVQRPRRWFAAAVAVGVPLLAFESVLIPFVAQVSAAFVVLCAGAAVGVAVTRAGRGAAWPAASMVAATPLLVTLPYALTSLFDTQGTAAITFVYYPGFVIAVGLSALVVEVLLAFVLAGSLLRRGRTETLPARAG